MKVIFRIFLCCQWLLCSNLSFAQTALSDMYETNKQTQSSSEYVFRSSLRDNLISVQILGAVARPGIYYIPPRTDLVKLLTLAGGPTVTADHDLIVRKSETSWSQMRVDGVEKDGLSYKVDVEKILKESQISNLTMHQQDVVYVPQKQAFISNDAFRTISVVSLLASIVLTGVLIEQKSKER